MRSAELLDSSKSLVDRSIYHIPDLHRELNQSMIESKVLLNW
jgi:hypothetical protein